MAQLTRFIPKGIKKCFDTFAAGEAEQLLDAAPMVAAKVRERLKAMWG